MISWKESKIIYAILTHNYPLKYDIMIVKFMNTQKVEFKYDVFKDGANILRVFIQPSFFDAGNEARRFKGLKNDFIEKVKKEKDFIVKQEIIIEYLKKFVSENKVLIHKKINFFSEEWGKINDIYFQRLSEILHIKIPQSTYIVYLTNAGSCPYSHYEKWLMARIGDEKVDAIVAHEIMHIEFQNAYSYGYFKKTGLSVKQYNDLKESLTVLLNEEMSDILSKPDYGYKEHQELRNKISKLWKQNKNFSFLLDNIIEFMIKGN